MRVKFKIGSQRHSTTKYHLNKQGKEASIGLPEGRMFQAEKLESLMVQMRENMDHSRDTEKVRITER